MSNAANILLVDDEPGMLRYIRTLLEVDEYKVETASSGEEAVGRVQKGLQPDLVLLDVLMPGIDGLQTLEQLRQLQPSVKVVMLSCVNDTRKVVQAMRLGAHPCGRSVRRLRWSPMLISRSCSSVRAVPVRKCWHD